MRIAVAGASGNVGARTVGALERDGHEVVGMSRKLGVDLTTGAGLDDALPGVEAVVDAVNGPVLGHEETVAWFGAATTNLLAAERRAGVRHHVLLSIAGLHEIVGNAHYAGKREQERLVSEGPIPWTILPATQFHDFAVTVAGWTQAAGGRGGGGPDPSVVRRFPRCWCSRSTRTTWPPSSPRSRSASRWAGIR